MRGLDYIFLFFIIPVVCNAQQLKEKEYHVEVDFKRKSVLILLENSSADSLSFSSFFVDQQRLDVFMPQVYFQREDTLIIELHGDNAISFAHEFKGNWFIEGQSREKELFILPLQKIYLKFKRKAVPMKDIRNIILKFKEKELIFDL